MSEVQQVLNEVFTKGRVHHPEGRYIGVKANISLWNSEALKRIVLERKPDLVVEIGMAYGVSTLSILGALEKNGSGRLISIDPYVGWSTGRLVALHQIKRAGVSHRHTYMNEYSYAALPKLLDEGVGPDIFYIDGNHNFDYVFTDFFFADKLLSVGGIVGFNDTGWRSVYKVVKFIEKYRKYTELDVGLPKEYRSRNRLFSMIKRIEGRSSNDRYFEKKSDWEPEHGYHRMF